MRICIPTLDNKGLDSTISSHCAKGGTYHSKQSVYHGH